ncbi:MAG: glycosyltransferase family protein, partial [Bacillota bacterium]
MKKIVYYISDHGYGHASRGIALLRELAEDNDIHIIVKTGRPLDFIRESLQSYNNIEYIYSENDAGLLLKKDSLEVDKQGLQQRVTKWVQSWDELIGKEVSYLKGHNIDCIISDITPWAFIAARKAGVKSIALSNFTWYDQYREILGENEIVEKVGNAYREADLFLRFPLHMDCRKAEEIKDIEFISRQINNQKVKEIKKNYSAEKKLIFVGIGKSVDYSVLQEIEFSSYKEYNWLFSAGTGLQGENIFEVPAEETEMQNYIAACDIVITKAGWSTTAETILAGVPLILIERENIPEDSVVINKVKQKG